MDVVKAPRVLAALTFDTNDEEHSAVTSVCIIFKVTLSIYLPVYPAYDLGLIKECYHSNSSFGEVIEDF
jgi:hypothetical protein